ncbi:MAG: beta-ketoacyl synthase N-terminal-like domain-containing protein [Bacteroidales bacterium]
MKSAKIIDVSLYTPLGDTINQVFDNLKENKSSVQYFTADYLNHPVSLSFFNKEQAKKLKQLSKPEFHPFESLLYTTAKEIIDRSLRDCDLKSLQVIVATTKGNIDQVENVGIDNLKIFDSVQKVCQSLKIQTKPLVVSSACISGLSAISLALRKLRQGNTKYALVLGADTVNAFVVSGFHSLMALSEHPCRPFDKDRRGINIGEAGAAMLLSLGEDDKSGIHILEGKITNDANHISAPSRTGNELAKAIAFCLHRSKITSSDIDFVSGHGTGTLYNDEMEAKAMKVAELSNTPIHSLKPYFGHCLGAAGILEGIILYKMMLDNTLIPSVNYQEQGTSEPLTIQKKVEHKALKYALKTMSGFGGCNAAVLFKKY